MSLQAPFWIPALINLDDSVYGGLDELSIPEGFNAAPVLADIGIDAKFVREFLYEVSHSFEALFLAGYKVPWVEFGLQHIAPVRILDEIASNQLWIRVDLQNRRVLINNRVDTDHANRVRLSVQPITTPAKTHALDMGQTRMDAVMSNVRVGFPHSTDVETMPMVDFVNDAGLSELKLVASDRSPSGVMDYREDVAHRLAELSGSGGTLELNLGLDHPTVSTDQAKDLCRLVFGAFRYAIFDSITWAMGHLTIAAVNEYVTAALANSADSDTSKLPGMFWVIDPATWESGSQRRPGPREVEAMLGELKVAPQLLLDAANRTDLVTFVDPPSETDGSHEALARTSKQGGFLYGIARGTTLKTGIDPATRVESWNMYPLERILDVMLGHAARSSVYEVHRANRKNPREALLAVDPRFKTNESLEGMLHDAARWESETDADHISQEVDYYLRNCRSAYHELALAFEPSGQLKLPAIQAKRALDHSYLTLILSLFNYDVFSIQQIAGDLNAKQEMAAVEVTDLTESPSRPRWRFTHSLYEHPGFEVELRSNDLIEGQLTIDDLVAWEYVPAQQEPPRTLREALVAADLFPENNVDRLVLVAGPGIIIRSLRDWPAQVPVDIYRVQSPALVPDHGERINTQLITAPYVISLLDDVTHVSGNNVENDLDRRHELQTLAVDHPDRLPFVTITPVRKNGKCGVTLATAYPRNSYYRGIDGTAAVEILVNETSGIDRFAFDIRYTIHKLKRAIGTHDTVTSYKYYDGNFTRTVTDFDEVDVAQFEIIVNATAGVEIKVDDTKIGKIYNLFVDVFGGLLEDFADPVDDTAQYEIWRGPLSDIPVQGTPLTPGGENFTVDPLPYDRAAHTQIAEQLEFIIDMSLGIMPVIGEATDVMELAASLYTGTDKWGRPMTNFDRLLILGGLALPLVNAKTLKVMKKELPAEELYKMVTGID